MVGEALVPYYRQILPILNIYKNKNCEFSTCTQLHMYMHIHFEVYIHKAEMPDQLANL